MLQRSGIEICRDKLFTLLRQDGILVNKRKKYTVTTNSRHWMPRCRNLRTHLIVHCPEQLLVADITYLDTLGSNCYLHQITDAYSKQIMGYELCNDMEARSTLKALHMAIGRRHYPQQPLIRHSDKGLKYCSKHYVEHLLKTISRSERPRTAARVTARS